MTGSSDLQGSFAMAEKTKRKNKNIISSISAIFTDSTKIFFQILFRATAILQPRILQPWSFNRGSFADPPSAKSQNFLRAKISPFNTFTANYELSRSPRFLYFCQLRDNSYFRDPLFLPTTSYLVVTKFIIFANYEITRTTLFLIFHLLTQKRMDFIIFVGKLKTLSPCPTYISPVCPKQKTCLLWCYALNCRPEEFFISSFLCRKTVSQYSF